MRPARWPDPVTWCCWHPPRRRWTCSRATASAATRSPRPCVSSATTQRGRRVTVTEPKPSAAPKRPRRERKESGFVAVRTALTAWLSRPLASFHLVLALTGVLTVIGVVMVLSASSVDSYNPKTGSGVYAQFTKHLVFVALGGVVFWLGMRVKLERIRRMSATATVICLGLLVLVLTPLGSTVNGSQGWFRLGDF